MRKCIKILSVFLATAITLTQSVAVSAFRVSSSIAAPSSGMAVVREMMPPSPQKYPEFYSKTAAVNGVVPQLVIQQFIDYQLAVSKSSQQTIASFNTGGTEKVLIIPIQFTDVAFSSSSAANHYGLVLDDLRNYYEMNSGFVSGSRGITVMPTVAPDVTSIHAMAWYGSDQAGLGSDNTKIYELAREAVRLLDETGFDFSPYDTNGDNELDHVMIVHAGGAQEITGATDDIWSHAWSIYNDEPLPNGEPVDGIIVNQYGCVAEDSPVGSFVHEFGHSLGLPDLYDVNGSVGGYTFGAGVWDSMSLGVWNALPGNPMGTSPANMSAWSRYSRGWADVSEITSDSSITINTNNGMSEVVKIRGALPESEYFLVELRNRNGFDSALPGDGVLVWHVNEASLNDPLHNGLVNADANDPGVELLQADGKNDLWNMNNQGDDGDPFPGSSINMNFDASPYNMNDGKVSGLYSYVNLTGITYSAVSQSAGMQVYMEQISPADTVLHPDKTVMYFTDTAKKLLLSYDYSSGEVKTTSFDLPCERMAYMDGKLYVTLLTGIHSDTWLKEDQSGVIAVLNADTLALLKTIEIDTDPFDIAVDNKGYMYISSGSGQTTDIDIRSVDTGALIDRGSIRQASLIELNPAMNLLVTLDTLSVDPSNSYVVYGIGDGTFTELPYLKNAGSAKSFQISPDGTYIFGDTGGVASLDQGNTWTGRIETPCDEIAFDLPNGVFYTFGGGTISKFEYPPGRIAGLPISRGSVDETGNGIFYHTDDLIYTYADTGGTHVTVFSADTAPAAPPVSFYFSDDINVGVLEGSNTDMEYSLDGGTSYLQVIYDNMFIDDLTSITSEHDVRVRVRSMFNQTAGLAQVIDILPGPAAPAVTADDVNNTVAGLLNTQMEFSTDNGATWINFADNLPDLTGELSLLVRMHATGVVMAGAAATLTFTSTVIPAMPSVNFSFDGVNAGKLMGITTEMEYSLNGGTDYAAATSINQALSVSEISAIAADKDIRVRVRSTPSQPAGLAQMIDIQPGPAAPAVTADDVNDTVSGLNTQMEFSTDNGSTWTPYAGNLPALSGNLSLSVRMYATGVVMTGSATTLTFTIAIIPPGGGGGGGGSGGGGGGDNGSGGGGSGGGGDNGSGVVLPEPPVVIEEDTVPSGVPIIGHNITLDDISHDISDPSVTGASVKLDLESDFTAVLDMDAYIAISSSGKTLWLVQGDTSIQVPADAIFNDFLKLGGDKGRIVITLLRLDKETMKTELAGLSANGKSGLFPVNNAIYQLQVVIVNDSETIHATSFNKPLVITVPAPDTGLSGIGNRKVGAYAYQGIANQWLLVGGAINPKAKTFAFNANRTGSFALMKLEMTFADIGNHWAKKDIELMSSIGVAKGMGGNRFNADGAITRGQFTALLVRMLELKENKAVASKFRDVSKLMWYAAEIEIAYDNGLLKGMNELTFRPDAKISRQEISDFIARTLKLMKGQGALTESEILAQLKMFADLKDVLTTSRESMAISVKYGFLEGRSGSRLVPKGNATRAESVVVLRRLLEAISSAAPLVPIQIMTSSLVPTSAPAPVVIRSKKYVNVIGTFAYPKQIYITNARQCAAGDLIKTPNGKKSIILKAIGNYIFLATDVTPWFGGQAIACLGITAVKPAIVARTYTDVIGTWANSKQVFVTNTSQCKINDVIIAPNKEQARIEKINGNYIYLETDVSTWIGGKAIILGE